MNLFEGLKEGDLQDIVIPLVSIDEYESKLDDDSIVVAFFVTDKDPANDLNRFIQKGAVDILDTDVSPAPNSDGQYMVFVEMLRDAEFPQKLLDTLASLEGLTGLEAWRAQIYDLEDQPAVSLELLNSHVRLQSLEEDQDDAVDESLTEFFRNSDIENMKLEGRSLELNGINYSMNFNLVDLGDFNVLKEHNAVLSQGLRLDETAQHNVSRISALLGDMIVVEHLENHVLLSSMLSEDVVLLELI